MQMQYLYVVLYEDTGNSDSTPQVYGVFSNRSLAEANVYNLNSKGFQFHYWVDTSFINEI